MILAMPTGPEVLEAIPIIISLIIIEGLLSVDNALAIAALASHLPKHQQRIALQLGIIGAYAFRGLTLLFVTWIIENQWIKLFGAGYLVYLMCSHLAGEAEEEDIGEGKRRPGLVSTVVSIEIMDLSLSIDNVVAAVALSPKLWVVCTGVFIGILALRFLAGYCIRLLERFPILGKTAFLLVGFVGFLLISELIFHFHVHSFQKFIGILLIVAATLFYGRSPRLQATLRPVLRVLLVPMALFAKTGDALLWPFHTSWRAFSRLWRQDSPEALAAVHIAPVATAESVPAPAEDDPPQAPRPSA
jgi:tellurite resistance protein TerC